MTVLAGINADVWMAATPSLNTTNELATDSGDHTTYTMSVHRAWDWKQPLTVQTANDEYEVVTITGGPTLGTFTLSWGGNTTAGLAIGSTAAQIQTALQGLPSIGPGNVLVTGANGGPWTVEFTGTLGNAPQVNMTSTNTFTGGTSPNVSITNPTDGIAWTTVVDYMFQYASGVIVFNTPRSAVTHARVSTGYYFNLTQLDNSNMWSLTLKANTKDTTTFQASGGWGTKAATTKEGSGKIDSIRSIDGRIFAEIGNVTAIQLYVDKTNNIRWDVIGIVTGVDPKADAKDIESQSMSFDTYGVPYFRTS